ncbi:MAG: hypothetical protein ACYC9M_02990 [Desulfobulbaceae bacterium]
MPTITYSGPEEISPPVALGQGRLMAFPKDIAVEVTDEVAGLVREQRQAGEFIIGSVEETAPWVQDQKKKR